MGEKYLLGVDVGTSSIKVAIINEKGKLKGITSGVYNLIQEAPGWQQIDADDMWRACLECIGRLKLEQKIDLGKIGGIGISCLCPGLAAFDREGHVLVNPIIYSDQRSVEEAEEQIRVNVDYALEINYEHLADCQITMDVRARDCS